MVKAGPSFQSIHHGTDEDSAKYLCHDKVADVMARYYARIGKIARPETLEVLELSEKQSQDDIYQCDNMSVNTGTQNQPESIDFLLERKRVADNENLENINRSRLKVKQTNTVLKELGREMKRLEVGGDFLRTVRNNLDEMDRNFWDWLL